MKAARLWRLVGANVGRNRRGFVLSAGGVALGIGCLAFFLALGAGLDAAVAQVFPASTREVEVVLPQQGGLTAVFGGDERKLDDTTLQAFRKIPGVETVFPKMSLRVPSVTRFEGPFFGKQIRMGLELVAVGVPEELIAPEAKLPFVDPGDDPTRPIPVVVNRRLLELYNKVFAPQRQMPRVTESMITGFVIPVELGRSWVVGKTLPELRSGSLQLVGFSDHATLAGVTLPLSTVRRLNEQFKQDATSYSSVLLRVRSSEQVPAVAAAVKAQGYEIDETERGRALQIGAAVRVVALALALLSALITALAAVNIAQAFAASVRERRREIGVLRAVGATANDVQRLFLAEAAATGLVGGLVGVIGARLAAVGLDWLARTRLPDFPFKPQTFFAFHAWMPALALGVALLAALLGALPPARTAARLDPARALGDG